MKVQAEVSLYPLRTLTLTDAIQHFGNQLCLSGLEVSVGPMSTLVSGECRSIFQTLSKAFEEVAHDSDVILTIKISNACPTVAKIHKYSESKSDTD